MPRSGSNPMHIEYEKSWGDSEPKKKVAAKTKSEPKSTPQAPAKAVSTAGAADPHTVAPVAKSDTKSTPRKRSQGGSLIPTAND